MKAPSDETCRETAQKIQSEHPHWLIMWGSYSREYTAFPLLPVPPGTFVHSPDPSMLETAMQEIELAAARDTTPGWQAQHGQNQRQTIPREDHGHDV